MMYREIQIEDLKAEGLKGKKEFDLFFKQYYSLFLSFARRYQLNDEESCDIVQEVFIAFWEQRANFSEIISIKSFFYRSVSNRCLNHLKHEDVKRRYIEYQWDDMEASEFMQENIIREEVSLMIHRQIKQLSPREQEVLILSLQNKTNQEIADQLSLSLATVKSHKMHAYARLRKQLDELKMLLAII